MALLMAACSDDYTDWATPQGYSQDDVYNVSLSVNSASAIDFANVTADSVQLFVADDYLHRRRPDHLHAWW